MDMSGEAVCCENDKDLSRRAPLMFPPPAPAIRRVHQLEWGEKRTADAWIAGVVSSRRDRVQHASSIEVVGLPTVVYL